jgi:hypothetical protein
MAQEQIELYFTKEAELTDFNFQLEMENVLVAWLEKSKKLVTTASGSVVDVLPRDFIASDEMKISVILEKFQNAVDLMLQTSKEEYEASVTALLAKRQRLFRDCFVEIQNILRTLGVTLPAEMTPMPPIIVGDAVPKHDFLNGLNAWLMSVTDLKLSQLSREVKQVIRLKYEPGSVYNAELNFTGKTSSGQVELHGRFIAAEGHAALGHYASLQMRCNVDPEFAGQSFVLELSHLTSDAGPHSRAPVTVRVNGHAIRENFCPRSMHEHSGNKVGMWTYVTDRWHVSSSLVHVGKNVVSVSYCNDGTSFYWIRSVGLHCVLPPTSTAEIQTQDLKKIFDAALTSRLHFGQEPKSLLGHVLKETSPMLALKATCQNYISVLAKLMETHEGGQAKLQENVGAFEAASTQCGELLASCVEMIAQVAAVVSKSCGMQK